jgi:hypothetical protein
MGCSAAALGGEAGGIVGSMGLLDGSVGWIGRWDRGIDVRLLNNSIRGSRQLGLQNRWQAAQKQCLGGQAAGSWNRWRAAQHEHSSKQVGGIAPSP